MVSVRTAGEADVPALIALRHQWNEESSGSAIDDSGFASAFETWWAVERTTRTFFLAEEDRAAIGMANVKRYDRMPVAGRTNAGWWGYVGNVFVVPAHRNRGVGQLLMDELIAWAGGAGMEHLRLAPSVRSVPFYRRLGFRPGAVVELDPPVGD